MGTRGTVTIICGGRKCTMWNKFDSYHSGLGLDLVKELKEILLHLDDWIDLWPKIEIVVKNTDPHGDSIKNLYPGSLHAVIESSSLCHSDWNDSAFNYTIDFDEQTFTCGEDTCRFAKLDSLQKYYELEEELWE
jgi:hypothetical protein